MIVYALFCTIGISTGCSRLIGLYSTKEKAEEAKQYDMRKNAHGEWHYGIRDIAIDKAVHIVYDEW